MQTSTSISNASDGVARYVIDWTPDDGTPTLSAVHIAHGMAEHSARYAPLAEALTQAGFAVSAADHRGHGRTTEEGPERGIFTEEGGWKVAAEDMRDMVRRLRERNPDVPLFLFGHSMGSLLAQQILTDGGEIPDLLAGVVLSATSGKPPFIASIGRLVARLERLRLGPRGRSGIIDALTFKDFNSKFKPARTGFDWLSRDEAQVDAYVADPDCGYVCSVQLWIDVLDAVAHITSDAAQSRIKTSIPILLFSGDKDPVGDMGKSVRSLGTDLERVGVTDLTCMLYPDARHELLNEINRDEVVADLLKWLCRVRDQ